MEFKYILFFALFVCAVARPDSGYNAPSEPSDEEERHESQEQSQRYAQSEESYEDSRSYEFDWNVQDDSDELDFGQSEKKSDGKVEGYYYVLLPDTRRQKVTYYVDGDSGFVADVTYEGEAQFDSHEEHSEEEYQRYQ